MPVLRRFRDGGTSGRLREPLGFTPREAYFGGLTPNEVGYTHMFRPHTEASVNPFGIAAHFEERYRPRIDALQEYLQPPFASLYARTLVIPWHLVPFFEVSERYSPWDPRKGYTSVFDLLTADRRRWAYVGWPFQQIPDAELCQKGLRELDADKDFVFVHLSELDSTGHGHGPHSVEMMAATQRTDQLLAALLERAADREILVFGDHGMVPVTKYVTIDFSSLPGDTLYFVDSTSVRVWGDARRLQCARDLLSRCDDVFEMDEPLLRKYSAEKVANGLTYWARPGVVLNPNFFGEGKVRGMHGYLPDVYDNESLFVVRRQGHGPRTVKPIDATAIHSILEALLGFDSFPALEDEERAAFTRIPAADTHVRTALDTVASVVQEKLPAITDLYLCGSFGRGEGTVRDARLINDLDLVYSATEPLPAAQVRQVADTLRERLQLPFVDLSPMLVDDCSQYAYEFRYGTRTLLGSSERLERRRHLASTSIPREAFEMLLLNRAAGFLSSFVSPYAESAEYRATQIVKIGLALAQSLLADLDAYHYSYFICQQRLELLPASLRPALQQCFDAKLTGRTLNDQELASVLGAIRRYLRDDYRAPQISKTQPSSTRRLYDRLYQSFVLDRPPAAEDITAWFRVIHPE